ncbi:MAG: LacI family DNA-binding transcriptional regulator [Clostridia bacterium]|nr:LacI family DNA-binding transcriptional regulator [Clostridia bacterium]
MTIKDVAEYSGVSISTISRVLNNHPDVREEVRAKVLKAIQELHYVPNSSARDLVKTQSDAIGVVVRGVENPFLTSVLRSIEEAIRNAGYTMVIHQIGTEDDELAAGAGLVRSKRLCGLILLGGRFDYTAEQIATVEVPFVCCTYTNSFGSLDKKAYSSVFIDDYAEAYKAVKLLIEKGHKKIAVLLDATDDRSISELRYKGYCAALRDAGIEFDKSLVEQTRGYSMKKAYNAAERLLARRRDFTALFTVSDSMGIAAIKALHGAGVKVPEDCSVIAIDGIEVSKYTIPALTTLIQPRKPMGYEAVRILVDVIKGKKNCQLRLKTELREGETVAPPKI